MKIAKPILFNVPSYLVLKLNEYLMENPPNFNYKLEYFYFIICRLISLHSIWKDEEFVTLNLQKLESSSVYNINSYLKILKNGEFIISDNNYSPGKKSKGYKINRKYLYGFLVEVKINPKTQLYKKILKAKINEKAHYNRLEPHLKSMLQKFKSIEIDYPKALNWILDNIPSSQQHFHINSINHIQDKRFRYFGRNKTNSRLDTNFTNLKSELRQFLKEDFVNIDLKNSQPFFLSILLNNIINNTIVLLCSKSHCLDTIETFGNKAVKEILKIHQKQKKSNLVNLLQFSHSTLHGTLYEDFIENYQHPFERVEAKEIMFKVLFSKNISYKNFRVFVPYEKEKEIFSEVFPFVFECVKILKAKDHTKLSIFLQRMESYIFIDCIAKELVENNIIPITIHDSVIVEKENKREALSIIQKVFLKKFGVIPAFCVGSLKNEEKSFTDEKSKCHLKQEFLRIQKNKISLLYAG
jgi:hypothetical protein